MRSRANPSESTALARIENKNEKKIDLGQTIGILANVGVIAGIGFLALEVRQNNDLMMADARRARSASSESAFRAVAENADFAEILVKAAQGEELSAVEAMRFRAFWTGLLVNVQSTFRDLRYPELESILSRYRGYQSTYPALTELWLSNKMTYERDFVELMDTSVFGTNE